MKTGLSLTELAQKIEANRELKRDFIADTSKTTMQVQEDKTVVLELPDEHGSFPLLPIAHDQIGARTGIPAKYYDRMRAEAPDLLAKLLGDPVRVFTTKCVQAELRSLGKDYDGERAGRRRAGGG